MKAWVRKALWLYLILLLSIGYAQPPRHVASAPQKVDLDAAAKATAALYASLATPPAASTMPAQTVAAPTVKSQPGRSQSSPLLPVAGSPVSLAVPAAGEVWQGTYQCAHAEKVQLRPDTLPEQMELQWKSQRWKLHRIDSHSGAMRLEDASARMVWIQLGNKSMLLDQHQGKRLLDECQHAVQVQTAAQMKTHPPPVLFDTTGMGR